MRYARPVNLVDELHSITAAFETAGLRYAVCGGLAVTIHGVVRSTEDIDVLVAPEDLPRVFALVEPLGYTIPAMLMTFGAGSDRERHVQRISKIVGSQVVTLDLLVADASLAGLLDDRVVVTLPQGKLTVVSRAGLLRMKKLAGRPQDLADIEKLEGET